MSSMIFKGFVKGGIILYPVFLKKVLDFCRDTEYNCVEIQGE